MLDTISPSTKWPGPRRALWQPPIAEIFLNLAIDFTAVVMEQWLSITAFLSSHCCYGNEKWSCVVSLLRACYLLTCYAFYLMLTVRVRLRDNPPAYRNEYSGCASKRNNSTHVLFIQKVLRNRTCSKLSDFLKTEQAFQSKHLFGRTWTYVTAATPLSFHALDEKEKGLGPGVKNCKRKQKSETSLGKKKPP